MTSKSPKKKKRPAPKSTQAPNKEEKKVKLPPKHIDWLIRNRHDTQTTSAALYRLLHENDGSLDQYSMEIQLLVSVAFSLWRSVFLSDKTGLKKDTSENAENFLREMLQNNIIGYPQERATKNWTFNYYVGNAQYRLLQLRRSWGYSSIGTLIPNKNDASPKKRWAYLQRAFEKAVDHFKAKLTES